jgi:Right handed beta helix region
VFVSRRLAGVTVTMALAFPASAAAATFEVDSLKDGLDATLADDLCATAGGDCTLRAAIEEANDQLGNDEIELPKGTIELRRPEAPIGGNAEGELDVTEAVEITGRGPAKTVIRQTVGDGVLYSAAPFAGFSAPGLQLSDVTITGGRERGAGEAGGAGVQNDEFALLMNVVVTGNVAISDESDDVPAGGIYSDGTLALSASTVRDNTARGAGEASPTGGGVVIQDGGFTLQDGSRIVRNSAKLRDPAPDRFATGGGLILRNLGANPEDSVSIFDSTIAANTAVGGGDARAGGISAGVGTNVELTRSTVSGNRSRLGGGLYATSSAMTVTNSTFSGNSDTADGGAAIWQQSGPGMIELAQVTIAKNRPSDGHFAIESGEQAQSGSLSLFGSIVSNPGPECGPEAGIVTSGGRNVVGDTSCEFNGLGGDLEAGPKLKPLDDYGGPTETHALKPTSPAIDHYPGCPAGVDQRGVSRPQGAHCDAGSFERIVAPTRRGAGAWAGARAGP